MPTSKKTAPKKPTPTVEKTVKQAVTSAARKSGPVAQVVAAAGIAAYDVAKTVKKRQAPRKPSPIKTRTVQLAKNLTRAQAMAAAAKKSGYEFRGFIYDRTTGKAQLT